jgi:hypothetical protein
LDWALVTGDVSLFDLLGETLDRCDIGVVPLATNPKTTPTRILIENL